MSISSGTQFPPSASAHSASMLSEPKSLRFLDPDNKKPKFPNLLPRTNDPLNIGLEVIGV